LKDHRDCQFYNKKLEKCNQFDDSCDTSCMLYPVELKEKQNVNKPTPKKIERGKWDYLCPACKGECSHLELTRTREKLNHIYTEKELCCYCQEKERERPNLFRTCTKCHVRLISR
jgi:hypothetical protein